MKDKKHILIISFYYPPNPVIGARRISKISKDLYKNGWIPHIITAKNTNYPYESPKEIPDEYIHELEWDDIWIKIDKIKIKWLRYLLKKTIFRPASSWRLKNWRKVALEKSLEIIGKHDIKIIYSTYSPKENIIIANKLKSKTNILWINEYRDLWYGNPYKKFNTIIDKYIEKKLIKKTDALITISEPLKEDLEKLHKKPTYVIYNGYDNEIKDFKINLTPSEKLKIVYTGAIYEGKRDPDVLFQALKYIKENDYDFYKNIEVSFFGPQIPTILNKQIKKYNIGDVVLLSETISHEKVIEIQNNSDILILLGWNNIKEKGIVTGKLFEYIGRLKPILAITYPDGEVASILKKTELGLVLTTPNDIVTYLYKSFKKKKNLNKEAIIFFSRKTQNQNLIKILEQTTAKFK